MPNPRRSCETCRTHKLKCIWADGDEATCVRCAKKGQPCTKPEILQPRKRSSRNVDRSLTWTQPLLYNGKTASQAFGSESSSELAERVKHLEELLSELQGIKTSSSNPSDLSSTGRSHASDTTSPDAAVPGGTVQQIEAEAVTAQDVPLQHAAAVDDIILASLGERSSSEGPPPFDVLDRTPHDQYQMSVDDLTSTAIAFAQESSMISGRCYLPPANDAYALLMEFLSDFNSKVPLIAPQHIYAHMRHCYSSGDAPRLSWMLTYLTLGIAHRLRAMSLFSGPDDMKQADWYLNQSLVKLPSLLMQEPSLELVQALLAVSVLLQTSSRSRRAALFVSNAMHMLQALGYHDGQTLERNVLRRKEQQYAFWIAFEMDTDMSLATMRQCAQNRSEIAVALPNEYDTDWWAGKPTPIATEPGACFNLFALNTSLALIQAEALETLFSLQSRSYPTSVLQANLQAILLQLQAWRRKSVIFSAEVQQLYISMYRSDIVHLIVLEATYFRTLYQLHAVLVLGTFGTKWDVLSGNSLRALAALDMTSCVADARRLLSLSALVAGANISTTW
ncbi:hypothetical protein LTR91_022930 [Friedmanniomyces endolithicus]|uniref:Zn(2)-C6 fungal-type domain-containing protein n=1 Tax=Friedmanniomyces endolithicus TaxID=329885 RepID=A0AAN6JYS7_9PEZI|nr:hypothetical protein LTS02_009243 [Friedmanniomyces endolithicus]KAK0868455.1 hypothetical protein LTR87_014153 [Friedmanniomyces endolithicus]KAK0894296.1 hypothetical protein LTR57_023600 [Friedmanniomyces endolithicus]KAK0955244.1 hypothetical protein LTR91_022930 [Friedmanniomyces endolithicus]KAK0987329.1 hypothetical protein LTS01_009599 [Friedmanniomyces endolithicus]